MNIQTRNIISILVCVLVAAGIFCALPYFSTNGSASAATKYKLYIKEGPLIIRSTYSTSGSQKGTIPKKKTVYGTVKKKASNGVYWYKVTYGGKSGYICGKYVKQKNINVTYNSSSYKKASVTADLLTIRSSASVKGTKVGTLKKGKKVTVKGYYKAGSSAKWYKITYSSKTRYICATYTKLTSTTTTPNATTTSNFESYMTSQGFPSSYKPYLRTLHKAHPKWVFKAQKTNLDWASMLSKEKAIGNNLVESSEPAKNKEKNLLTYNYITGKYKVFDGKWNQASYKLIAYYLDPRNFLNDTGVYQFMTHYYSASSQNASTVKSITTMNSSCFLSTNTYYNYLVNAGKSANVNPNVLTAMIIQEQGWNGASNGLISGKYSGYKGYYNYFNIGAYTANGMTATQRGLWYAKGSGTGATSYGRPWNTRQKSITGGAKFYSTNYVTKKQYTYYTKKFNVANGLSNVASHEYMTNVEGAYSEGKILKYAYRNNSNYANIFYIPVYKNIPSKVCAKP